MRAFRFVLKIDKLSHFNGIDGVAQPITIRSVFLFDFTKREQKKI